MPRKIHPELPLLALVTALFLLGCSAEWRIQDDGDGTERADVPVRDDAQVLEAADATPDAGTDPTFAPPGCEMRCRTAGDCGRLDVFCDGKESCDLASPDPVTGEGCCDVELACPQPADPCMGQACVEETHSCAAGPLDGDRDGYPAALAMNDLGGEQRCEGGTDCADDDAAVHPGAEEVCDEADNDCDGLADETGWSAIRGPEAISTPGAQVADAAIAAFDDGWIIAWTETGEAGSPLNIGKFSSTQSLRHSPPDITGAGEIELIAAPSGDTFLFWIENGTSIKGQKLALTGSGFQEIGAPILVYGAESPDETIAELDAAAPADFGSAALFFRSQKEGNYEIYMIRVSLASFGEAAAIPPDRITRAIGFSGYPSAAAIGGDFGLAWEDERDGNKEIYFAFVSAADGVAGTPARLTAAPGDSKAPSVAATSGGFAVAWMDESAGPFNLFYARVGADGLPAGYPAAMNGLSAPQFYPSVSPDPREPDHLDQILLVYVLDEGAERKLFLTAADKTSAELQQGSRIHSTSRSILGPSIAGGQSSKAVIWIEWIYTESSLYLLTLECPA